MQPSKTRAATIVTEREAERLAVLARDTAEARGLAIAVAITDGAGRLLAFRRMDRAAPITVEVAIAKARTAALLGAPSRLFEDMINAGETAMVTTPGVTPLRGGLPLIEDGGVCGAIGVSGATGEEDERLAADVVAAFDAA